MTEAVAGSGKTVLAEAVRWADRRSVDCEMRRGSRTGGGGDTGVPVPRLVLDAIPQVPESPATPAPAPEQESSPEIAGTPDAVTAPAPPDVVGIPKFPLTPGEKTPLDVLLGKRKPNRAQKAALRLEVAPPPAPPKAAAVEPLRPEPAAAPGWVVPPEIAAQLTHREVLLLQIEDNRLDARHVYNKIFLAMNSPATKPLKRL